jgi:tRNA-dihydrouridine synthase 1
MTLPSAENESSSLLTSNTPIDRDWLRKLLQKHPNPTTPADLRTKALVVAPMVDQSDLPFRLQCRRYGSNLCYTPMIHSKLFVTSENYRAKFWMALGEMPKEDRPLIAQFCGSDPEMVLKAASYIKDHVDGIDLNCGCPQGIAKKGQYGAYLLEETETLLTLVRRMVNELGGVPITVKVRLLPTGVADSLILYQQLVDCGISLLCIHGRNRHQKQFRTGKCDWDAIRQAVDLLGHRIPILANGGISNLDDVRECLRVTGADGVMSSEAVLEYPPVFTESQTKGVGYKRLGPGRLDLAREYVELAKQYPPKHGGQGSGSKCIRGHMHKFLHEDLQEYADLRDRILEADTMPTIEKALGELAERHEQKQHSTENEALSWYIRHRDASVVEEKLAKQGNIKEMELEGDSGACFSNLFGSDDGEY